MVRHGAVPWCPGVLVPWRTTRDRLAASGVTQGRERRLNGMLTSATVTDTAILLERETRLRIRMLRLALRVGHWIRVHLYGLTRTIPPGG